MLKWTLRFSSNFASNMRYFTTWNISKVNNAYKTKKPGFDNNLKIGIKGGFVKSNLGEVQNVLWIIWYFKNFTKAFMNQRLILGKLFWNVPIFLSDKSLKEVFHYLFRKKYFIIFLRTAKQFTTFLESLTHSVTTLMHFIFIRVISELKNQNTQKLS